MAQPPVILFGAGDRHNFGDLLLANIAARLHRRRRYVFAGLAERDLRACGGQRVRAIAALATEWRQQAADIVHYGGEILSCTLYEAAVMLQSPAAARAVIFRYDADPVERQRWAAAELGLEQQIAYLAPWERFRNPRRIVHCGIGGVDFSLLTATARSEILDRLRGAAYVGVRDAQTRKQLAAAGIDVHLAPDPAQLTAKLFAAELIAHALRGPAAAARRQFPQGYLALQFSADYGEDATLHALATQLQAFRAATGLGIVLFRAGLAPWHDDLAVYRRFAAMLPPPLPVLFVSPRLWDIAALIAGTALYCGTSLHGRIVASACAKPALNLIRDPRHDHKLRAYAATWFPDVPPASLPDLAAALDNALAIPKDALLQQAESLATLAQAGYRPLT